MLKTKKILKNEENNKWKRNNTKYPYNFNYIYYIKIIQLNKKS